jgi:predicted dehydrogenase
MSESHEVTRRGFLETTAAAGAAGLAAPLVVSASALGMAGAPGANGRIRLGLIGCGGMGRGNLSACSGQPDVVVTAACDPWKPRRDAVVAESKGTCKGYHDYRDLLQQKDVDAVIIASPPHWHTLQAIDACRAGKDIYVQKPMTLHLAESLALRNAVKKHDRISQVGTQVHASANYRRIVELVRAGNLGHVSAVRTYNVMNQGPEGIGHDPNTTPPPGFDWELWVGPGKMRPFNRILVDNAYNHCSWMDYSGGWLPGMAPHIIDQPIWALDLGFPTKTSCHGGRFVIRDDGDAPDVQEVLWQYPNLVMTWMGMLANSYGFDLHGEPVPQRRLGIYFHGVDGTMYCNYDMHRVIPEGDRMKGRRPPKQSIPPSPGHEREWLDSIKSRKQPSCSVSYHVRVDVPLVLANLSLRLGLSIQLDPATGKIVGDEEAARLSKPEYRAPWKFPEEYL